MFLWIESNNFQNVSTFSIRNHALLSHILIEQNAFTEQLFSFGNDTAKSFSIVNCTHLISIQIGPYSFSDYAGPFVLQSLPLLRSLLIGSVNHTSYNFYSSSFTIIGSFDFLLVCSLRRPAQFRNDLDWRRIVCGVRAVLDPQFQAPRVPPHRQLLLPYSQEILAEWTRASSLSHHRKQFVHSADRQLWKWHVQILPHRQLHDADFHWDRAVQLLRFRGRIHAVQPSSAANHRDRTNQLHFLQLLFQQFHHCQYDFFFQLHGIDLPNLKSIVIGDRAFANSTHFSIENTERLFFITIGSGCFRYVDVFRLIDLPYLEYLRIGSNSFTQTDDNFEENKNRSFQIVNCTLLISIEIGPNSFADYAGGFELVNLPSLEIIMIGCINVTSYNFYYSSFVIFSLFFSNLNDWLDLPNLVTIELGDYSFSTSLTTVLDSIIDKLYEWFN